MSEEATETQTTKTEADAENPFFVSPDILPIVENPDDVAALIPIEEFEWISDVEIAWNFDEEEPSWEAGESEFEEPDSAPSSGSDELDEYLALEIRSEQIREVVLGNAHRVAAHDELWMGHDSQSFDTVLGKETVRVNGHLREHTGGGHSTTAKEVHTSIEGKMEVRASFEDSIILGGAMTDIWNCGTFIGAAMSDDLCVGAGARVTAPTDLWLHGLMGMEERPGTAAADAIFGELYGTLFEREYGPGAHVAVTATFTGAVYQTQATGFRPLMKIALGVRNLIPAGGGGAGEAGVGAPPAAAAAGAGTVLSAAAALRVGASATESAASGDEILTLLRGADEIENLSNVDDARHAPDTAQRLSQVQDAVQAMDNAVPMQNAAQVGDEAGSIIRAGTEGASGGGDAVHDAARDDIYSQVAMRSLGTPLRVEADEQGVVTVSDQVFSAIAEGVIQLEVDDFWGGPLDVGEYTLKIEGYQFVDGKLTNIATGEVLDLDNLGLASRLADPNAPPPFPPGRPLPGGSPRSQFGFDEVGYLDGMADLNEQYMTYRRDLKWDGVLAYGDAIKSLDNEVMDLFKKFGGDADELAQSGKPANEAAYLALGRLAWECDEAGFVEKAAEIREALEALNQRTRALVEDLGAKIAYFDAGGLPGTTGLQPEIDKAKLLEFVQEQQQAAMDAFVRAQETMDPAQVQEASFALDYWNQIQTCIQGGENPMAFSSGMVAYLNNMGQTDQAAYFLRFQDALMDVLSNPDYHHTGDALADAAKSVDTPPANAVDNLPTQVDGIDEGGGGTSPTGTQLDTGELPSSDPDFNRGSLDGSGAEGTLPTTQAPEWNAEAVMTPDGAHWSTTPPVEGNPPVIWDSGTTLLDPLEESVTVLDEAQQAEEARQLQNGVPMAAQIDESIQGASKAPPPPVPDRTWADNRPPRSFGFSPDDPSAPAWIKDDYAIERQLAAGEIPAGFTQRDDLLELWQSYSDECRHGKMYGANAPEMREFANFIDSISALVDDDTSPVARIQEALPALRRQAAEGGPDSAAYWKLTLLESMQADLQNALAQDFGYRANSNWVVATDALLEMGRTGNASPEEIAHQQDEVWGLFDQYNYGPMPERPHLPTGNPPPLPPQLPPHLPPRPGTSTGVPPLGDPQVMYLQQAVEGQNITFLGRQAQDVPPVPPRVDAPPVPPRTAPPVPPRQATITNLEDARRMYNAQLGLRDGAHIPDLSDVALPSFWDEMEEADRVSYIHFTAADQNMDLLAGGQVQNQMDDFVSEAEAAWRTTFREEILPHKYPQYVGTSRANKLEELYGRALAANDAWSKLDFSDGNYLEDTASSARSVEFGDARQSQMASEGGKVKKSVKFGDAEAMFIHTDVIMTTDETGNVFPMYVANKEPPLVIGESDAVRVVPVPEGWQARRTPGMGRTAAEPGAFPFTTQEYLVNRLMQEGPRTPAQIGYGNVGSSMNRLTSAVEQGYSTGRIASEKSMQKLDELLGGLKVASKAAIPQQKKALILGLDTEMLKFLCWLTDVSRRVY